MPNSAQQTGSVHFIFTLGLTQMAYAAQNFSLTAFYLTLFLAHNPVETGVSSLAVVTPNRGAELSGFLREIRSLQENKRWAYAHQL